MKLNIHACSACKDHHYDVEVTKLEYSEWINTSDVGSAEYDSFFVCQNTGKPVIVYVRTTVVFSAVKK